MATSKFLNSIFCSFTVTILLLNHATADPPYYICSNTSNFANNNIMFNTNLNNLLSSLNSNASLSNFFNTSIGTDSDSLLHGLFLCYKYVSSQDCETCIHTASQDIQKGCPNTGAAIVWEENCQLRYSNVNFFGQFDSALFYKPLYNVQNVSEPDQFRIVVNDTLQNLTNVAAFGHSNGMYATVEVPFKDSEKNVTSDDLEDIHALVQCSLDLSPEECGNCLRIAITNISACYFSRGARVLGSSCYLRYEFYDFYHIAEQTVSTPVGGDSTPIKGANAGNYRMRWKIVALSIGSAILFVLLLVSFVYCLVFRYQAEHKEIEISTHYSGTPDNVDDMTLNLCRMDNFNSDELPFIDMETLSAATDNFSDSNKLGQGGFGPVYKGILPDGVEVAVKRLSTNSEQGRQEFINEVQLIHRLQHKNLVRLFGFSVDREEKLLIYEYMPNNSLDVFLIDPRKRAELEWSTRLQIINGIARGTLYLHQDSRLNIIHRDLKPSNVLLDREMNPKISDFGMARIFGGNDSAANTAKIVGTFGYMAPEFAMEGLYSIKSDVYSFGVLLLEIISGRKNAGFHLSRRAPSLVAYAWRLWNEGTSLELMDPLLSDSCNPAEFLRCVHIGLLCVQENAYDRPTMSSVVLMLKSQTVNLCEPEQPALSFGRFNNHDETCYNNLSINNLTISNILPR